MLIVPPKVLIPTKGMTYRHTARRATTSASDHLQIATNAPPRAAPRRHQKLLRLGTEAYQSHIENKDKISLFLTYKRFSPLSSLMTHSILTYCYFVNINTLTNLGIGELKTAQRGLPLTPVVFYLTGNGNYNINRSIDPPNGSALTKVRLPPDF